MKRSALASAVLSAALGFVAAGAVVFAPSLEADDTPARRTAQPTNQIATASFTITPQVDAERGGAALVVTNLTKDSMKITWTQQERSTGKMNPMSRIGPVMKDVSTPYTKAIDVPGMSKTVVVLEEPAATKMEPNAVLSMSTEMRQMIVEASGQSLQVQLATRYTPREDVKQQLELTPRVTLQPQAAQQ